MEDVQNNAVETTFDHKFSRDLIYFVLHEYMTGLHWVPTGMFLEKDLDTPFTPQLKEAVKEELGLESLTLHLIYDEFFPDKSVIEESYMEVFQKLKDTYVLREFHLCSFLSFCVLMALFAGLSYHYGVILAPFASYKVLVETLKEMKNLRKIDDNMWNEMQTMLESGKWPIRLWTSELDSSDEEMDLLSSPSKESDLELV